MVFKVIKKGECFNKLLMGNVIRISKKVITFSFPLRKLLRGSRGCEIHTDKENNLIKFVPIHSSNSYTLTGKKKHSINFSSGLKNKFKLEGFENLEGIYEVILEGKDIIMKVGDN